MASTIKHKVRGISIGRPLDHDPFELTVRVTGDPDFAEDAREIFSFLFIHCPDGTMQELVRLISENLRWASDLVSNLPNAEPSPLTWSQLAELKALLEADPAATADAMRRVSGSKSADDPSQITLF